MYLLVCDFNVCFINFQSAVNCQNMYTHMDYCNHFNKKFRSILNKFAGHRTYVTLDSVIHTSNFGVYQEINELLLRCFLFLFLQMFKVFVLQVTVFKSILTHEILDLSIFRKNSRLPLVFIESGGF
jgi:hypothetical protein